MMLKLKVNAGVGILPLVNCVSPASAFRHQSQSGWYRWSQISPTFTGGVSAIQYLQVRTCVRTYKNPFCAVVTK
jgi:hypothetical protein